MYTPDQFRNGFQLSVKSIPAITLVWVLLQFEIGQALSLVHVSNWFSFGFTTLK